MKVDVWSALGDIIERQRPVGQDIERRDDGLAYCISCGGAKEKRIMIAGQERVVPCLCKCEKEKRDKEKAEEAARQEMLRVRDLKASSGMDKKLRGASFSAFEETDDNRAVLALAKKYTGNFKGMEERNQGLLFYGSVGTGKSYTAACIANALMEEQVSVIMTSFVKILLDIRGTEDEAGYMTMLNRPRLLIIDDLGAERNTEYALEKVYGIIDNRVRAEKPMILTTNLSLEEMMECRDIRYQRIYDRILEVCYPVEMNWKSFRRRTAAERFNEMKRFMEG